MVATAQDPYKKLRTLQKKLERSDRLRVELEELRDNDQRLYKQLHADVEKARTTIERNNAELQCQRDQILEQRDELARSLRALEESHAELKRTQAQLIHAEKLASLGRLTAGIAHEIKNPLNFVDNFAEVNEELVLELEEELTANKDRRIADVLDGLADLLSAIRVNAAQVAKHGKRADRIVATMMDHARDGTGERFRVEVNPFVDEYADLSYHGMQAQLANLNVTIERAFDEAVGTVDMAPRELGRALLNLLNNALEAVHRRAQSEGASYTPAVKLSTRQKDGRVEIRVTDNGAGIPAEIEDKIFEPFFTMKPAGSGTGLGLSLAHDIVSQGHGGTLRVDNSEGEGAVFVVTLPSG